jgi:tetratricopeptide (TPR) repeat protein
LLDSALAASQPPDPQAAQWAGKALDAYQQAIDLNPDAAEYGNPVAEVAKLSQGNAYRLQGAIAMAMGDNASGAEAIQKAIETLEQLVPVFAASTEQHEAHRRYLAQAYEYLGLAYQWQGTLLEREQAYAGALDSYQKALDAFNGCISQAEKTLDLVIQNEIVAQSCQPYFQQTQEVYNALNGGQ